MESATLPEANSMERYSSSSGIERDLRGTEDKCKKRRNSLLPETTPAMHPSSSEVKKCTSEASFENVEQDELEFDIEKARLDILNHFMIMKTQMDNEDKVVAKEMEIWTQEGLANISGGKPPQNEFFMKSLIDNFEEIIRSIGQESKRDANHIMDDIRKILINLLNRIELSFRPRPSIDSVRMTRGDAISFLWIGLWSLIVILIAIFPEYLLTVFETAVAFYYSTILIIFLFCILYFSKPVYK